MNALLERPRVRVATWATLGLLTLLPACSSVKLRVLTEPTESVVEIGAFMEGEKVKEFRFEREVAEVSLRKNIDRVTLLATSVGFHEASVSLSRLEVEALPEGRGSYHELTLPMDREFSDVAQLVIGYDATLQRFVGRKRFVRAFEDTREDSAVVGKVYDKLPEGYGIRGMDISPDGRQLVFAEAEPVPTNPGAVNPQHNQVVELATCSLKAINLLDKGGKRITGGVTHLRGGGHTDVDPIFTPDGQSLRFASDRRRPDSADILQINAKAREGGIQNIYVDMRDYTALRPTMGADGVMVFVLYPPHGGAKSAEASAKIWAVGGGNPYETGIIEGIQPHVSPDGARVAYIGQDRNLWVVNTDGTVPTQLTFEAERITERYRESLSPQEQESFSPGLFRPYSFPSWSPDGSWILMSSLEGNLGVGRFARRGRMGFPWSTSPIPTRRPIRTLSPRGSRPSSVGGD